MKNKKKWARWKKGEMPERKLVYRGIPTDFPQFLFYCKSKPICPKQKRKS